MPIPPVDELQALFDAFDVLPEEDRAMWAAIPPDVVELLTGRKGGREAFEKVMRRLAQAQVVIDFMPYLRKAQSARSER